VLQDGEKVSFVWNRGSKLVAAEPANLSQQGNTRCPFTHRIAAFFCCSNESAAIAAGVARWTEGLVVICTLYRVGGKGPAAGSFFKKTAKVSVVAHLILLGATLGYHKSRRQVMITSVQNDRTTSTAAQRLAGKVFSNSF
jgi:hypothetical protein